MIPSSVLPPLKGVVSIPARTVALVVEAGSRACAIPVEHVVETMRPLAIETMAGSPRFVLGVSVIRGAPVPVVDLEALLTGGDVGDSSGRFVVIRAGDRRVALAVDDVVGLRELDSSRLRELPPLLRGIGTDVVESIGAGDAQLLVVLQAARILPEPLSVTLPAGTVAR